MSKDDTKTDPKADENQAAKDQAEKQEKKGDEKQAPAKPQEATFKTARYPQAIIQVPGKSLRKSIKFEDGTYVTKDEKEIALLDSDKVPYVERVDG